MFVRAACDDADFPADLSSALLQVAARIAGDPSIRALAQTRHIELYRTEPFPTQQVRVWPLLADDRHPDADLIYVLIALSGVPEMRALYHRRGISDTIYRHGLTDLLRWMQQYRTHLSPTGAWGLAPRYLTWLRHHFKGELFHLGRLQFEPGAASTGAHFFRHVASGRVLALSDAGETYRSDGQLQGAGGVTDPDGTWTATFHRDETRAAGYPMSPYGHAMRDLVSLPLDAWHPVLSPGDPVLNVHMPAGSPMGFEACGESFAQALEFFPRHFPERPFAAFTCSSWLLDPQLDGPLMPESNIVRFQRQVYLLPSASDGKSTLDRVFGRTELDTATAPRDTALRRAVLDLLAGGGHIRSGRCVVFPEDIRTGAWGAQQYRRTTLKRKAFAYVTHRDAEGERLLIFSHPEAPEAGLQVPAGTIEEGEDPAAGALREAREETGLTELELVGALGEHLKDRRDRGMDELHHRYFFHIRCTDTSPPVRWRTYEESPSDQLAAGVAPAAVERHLFEHFWVRLPDDVPPLTPDHDRFLPELMRRIG